MTGTWAEALLARIAHPRLPGSDAVADAESAIVEDLAGLEFTVQRESFVTSPRRLYAVSIAGAGAGWAALGIVLLLWLPFPGWSATVTGLAVLAAVGLVAVGIAEGKLPLDVPAVTASNIVATRGDRPRIWLVAHSDSKAQRISLRGRVMASVLMTAGLLGLIGCLLVRLAGPLPLWSWMPWLLATVVGGAMLSARPLRGGSPGAVDNASGVVAALSGARALRDRDDVGVLITGAEEYGMEGARAWIASGAGGEVFVNFDGIDSRGLFNVMPHRVRRSTGGRSGDGSGVLRAVTAALQRRSYGVRPRALPLGVFVDGSVLAAGGIPGLTVSRGDWETLGIVHTASDGVDRFEIGCAVDAGEAVAEAVRSHFG